MKTDSGDMVHLVMNVYTEGEGDHLCRLILFVQQSESNAWKTD